MNNQNEKFIDSLLLERESLLLKVKYINDLLELYSKKTTVKTKDVETTPKLKDYKQRPIFKVVPRKVKTLMNIVGVENVKDLTDYSVRDLKMYRGVGSGTIDKAIQHLKELNLKLRSEN